MTLSIASVNIGHLHSHCFVPGEFAGSVQNDHMVYVLHEVGAQVLVCALCGDDA